MKIPAALEVSITMFELHRRRLYNKIYLLMANHVYIQVVQRYIEDGKVKFVASTETRRPIEGPLPSRRTSSFTVALTPH